MLLNSINYKKYICFKIVCEIKNEMCKITSPTHTKLITNNSI